MPVSPSLGISAPVSARMGRIGTMDAVPDSVPSLFQSWWEAVKKRVPLTLVIWRGWELSVPGLIFLIRALPASLASVSHNSRPSLSARLMRIFPPTPPTTWPTSRREEEMSVALAPAPWLFQNSMLPSWKYLKKNVSPDDEGWSTAAWGKL